MEGAEKEEPPEQPEFMENLPSVKIPQKIGGNLLDVSLDAVDASQRNLFCENCFREQR